MILVDFKRLEISKQVQDCKFFKRRRTNFSINPQEVLRLEQSTCLSSLQESESRDDSQPRKKWPGPHKDGGGLLQGKARDPLPAYTAWGR